jgi:hypothetical protein
MYDRGELGAEAILEALEPRLARTVRNSRMAAGDRFPQDAAQRSDYT